MPSRTKRFTRSLITGYGGLGVNILVSLVSIPLALSYLSKEEFGLWALALQINGYLALIDFGMSGAVGRFLTDHKDDVNGTAYREHFSTGFFVFLVQSLLVILLGMGLSWIAPNLLSIPHRLSADFTFLLRALCLISAVSIATRALSSPLWAFQRMDVVNLGGMIGLIFQFITMWLGFHLGYGVTSFVVACAIPVFVAVLIYAYIGRKYGYFPRRRGWFCPRWSIFKETLAFGRDGMLVSIGSLMVNATQITIISRMLGLDAAASFSVATKLYGMSLMLFHKVIESAAPGLAEMYVRGEMENFIRRYWDAIAITLATAFVGAVAIAAGNSAFVTLWTGGKVSWSPISDLLLGFLVLVTSMSRCFMAVFGVTKNLKPIRIIYFLEGVVFVPTAILAAKWYGVEGVLTASLVVHVGITLLSSSKATAKVIGSPKPLIPLFLVAFVAVAVGFTFSLGVSTLNLLPVTRLASSALPLFGSIVLVWFIILPDPLRRRLKISFMASTRFLSKSA